MEVRGAEVPRVDMMDVGLLMSSRAWFKKEPAIKEPRKTVMNCAPPTQLLRSRPLFKTLFKFPKGNLASIFNQGELIRELNRVICMTLASLVPGKPDSFLWH